MVGDSAWARANLSEPGYCLANWRLALRYWTADIIMAVSFVSEPEPTWQMIGALLRCKQCKPGIFSVKSGDNPPKMKRFCDSLYSVCWPQRPRRSARGWWAGARGWRPPCTASARTPRECPGQAGGPCQKNGVVNVYLVLLLWEWITFDQHFTCGAVSLFLLQIFVSPGLPVFVFALKFYWWRVKNVVIKQIKTWRVWGKELGQEDSWQTANEDPVGVKPGQCDLWWGDELEMKLN